MCDLDSFNWKLSVIDRNIHIAIHSFRGPLQEFFILDMWSSWMLTVGRILNTPVWLCSVNEFVLASDEAGTEIIRQQLNILLEHYQKRKLDNRHSGCELYAKNEKHEIIFVKEKPVRLIDWKCDWNREQSARNSPNADHINWPYGSLHDFVRKCHAKKAHWSNKFAMKERSYGFFQRPVMWKR